MRHCNVIWAKLPSQPPQPPPPRHSLPVELYRPIVEAVTAQSDLHSLLLVNKVLQDESERLLYRSIRIEKQELYTRLRLFKHLSNCDRVANHLRKLLVFGLPYGPEFPPRITNIYWRSLNRALCAIPFLKDLLVVGFVDLQRSRYPPFSLLSGCTFQLRTLTFHGIRALDHVALENQKNLEELHIRFGKLSTIVQGTFNNLLALSVDSFTNLDPMTLMTVGVKALHASSISLKTTVFFRVPFILITSLSLWDFNASFIIDLPALFPSLRYLRLKFNQPCWKVIEAQMDHLGNLSYIQKFHISCPNHEDSMEYPEYAVALPWFSKIASLEAIVFEVIACYCMEVARDAKYGVFVVCNEGEWKDSRWM